MTNPLHAILLALFIALIIDFGDLLYGLVDRLHRLFTAERSLWKLWAKWLPPKPPPSSRQDTAHTKVKTTAVKKGDR